MGNLLSRREPADPTPIPRQSAGGPSTKSATKSQSQKPSEKPTEKGPDASIGPPNPFLPPWRNDLCGLEHIPGSVVWEGPQRIKACQQDEPTKAKFKRLLDRLFSEETVLGRKLPIEPNDIGMVVKAVIPYFESEPMLIEDVPFDVTIVGDIHGQFHDLVRLFKADEKDGKPGWESMKYVFLGDYVDRGRQSVEVIVTLFILKCLHPDRIFLLRGNHEFMKINKKYGFLFEIGDRYSDQDTIKSLFILFNEAFCWMSIAAIVGNIYFCSHGGIALSGFTRRHMRGLYKPVYFSAQDTLIQDITWSDPAGGLRGSAFNKERNTSVYFGFDELCKALASMEVVAIFRGHTRLDEGFAHSWHVCYTVFTATNYENMKNVGAVARVGPTGKVQIQIIKEDPIRTQWEARMRAVEYEPDQITDEQKKKDPLTGKGKLTEVA